MSHYTEYKDHMGGCPSATARMLITRSKETGETIHIQAPNRSKIRQALQSHSSLALSMGDGTMDYIGGSKAIRSWCVCAAPANPAALAVARVLDRRADNACYESGEHDALKFVRACEVRDATMAAVTAAKYDTQEAADLAIAHARKLLRRNAR